MKINRITAGVAALVMSAVTPAFFMDDGTNVVCAEKVYDVKLSAETVEIDINDIPENREVMVGINLDNNPGMQGLLFWIKKDNRLDCEEVFPFEFDNSKRGIGHGFYDNKNVLEIKIIPNIDFDSGELTYDSGLLFKWKLKLPSDVAPGDFFEVKPLLDFADDPGMSEPGFYRANDFDSFFGRENFAEPVAGGIRITGQKAEPSLSPEPSPSPTPEQKPTNQSTAGNSPSPSAGDSSSNENNGSENRQETQAVTTTVSESVSVSVSESTSESVSVSETTVSKIETPVTSVSKTEITAEETTVASETTVTETAAPEIDNTKNKIITAVLAFAAAFAGVCTYIITHRNKKNKEN